MLRSLSSAIDFVLGEFFYTQCYLCEIRLDNGLLCSNCSIFERVLNLTEEHTSLFWLDEKARIFLHLVKYGKNPMYLNIFRKDIQESFSNTTENFVIIPIPLSLNRFLERGFNQSWILGDWIAKKTKQKMLYDALLKDKDTEVQASLSRTERKKNLRNSFHWNRRYEAPKEVLLVDDVYTTGATVLECHSVLEKIGVKRVHSWTLFKTPERQL